MFAKFDFYPYGLLISCIFLTVTLLVYLLLPKVFNNAFSLFFKMAMTGGIDFCIFVILLVAESTWKNFSVLCHIFFGRIPYPGVSTNPK